MEHTKAPPDEYSAVFLLNITVEYCCMMTLLSENAAALPQSAVLLMNVMKEYPENMVLTSLKVQIAPAKGCLMYMTLNYYHNIRTTFAWSLKVTPEYNTDTKFPHFLVMLPLKIALDLSLNMTLEL